MIYLFIVGIIFGFLFGFLFLKWGNWGARMIYYSIVGLFVVLIVLSERAVQIDQQKREFTARIAQATIAANLVETQLKECRKMVGGR